MSREFYVYTLLVLAFFLSLIDPFSSSISEPAKIITIPFGDRDSSIMRIKSEEREVYGIVVDGYGYGVYAGEILSGVSRLAIFRADIEEGVKWLKLIVGNHTYKTRSIDIYNDRLYVSYTSLAEGISKLVLLAMSKDGDLINAVSAPTQQNLLLNNPGFVNDLVVTDDYVYIAGGWHLYPQPSPYNISPFIYMINSNLSTGYRIVVQFSNGSEISGSIFSLDLSKDQLYFCGSLVDAYHQGSRSDFIVGSIDKNGTLRWILAFDLYMGIDHCRGVTKIGNYVYAIGRSWYNSLGDHLIIVKIHESGVIESMWLLKHKAEPVSVESNSVNIHVLLGHSPTHQLLVLSLDGRIERALDLKNTQGGLDLDLDGDHVYISGSTVNTPTRGQVIQLNISQIEIGRFDFGGIEIIDITKMLEYEPYFEVNYIDPEAIGLNVEKVYLTPCTVDLLDIPLYETISTTTVGATPNTMIGVFTQTEAISAHTDSTISQNTVITTTTLESNNSMFTTSTVWQQTLTTQSQSHISQSISNTPLSTHTSNNEYNSSSISLSDTNTSQSTRINDLIEKTPEREDTHSTEMIVLSLILIAALIIIFVVIKNQHKQISENTY